MVRCFALLGLVLKVRAKKMLSVIPQHFYFALAKSNG